MLIAKLSSNLTGLPECMGPSTKERAELLPVNQTAPSWEDLEVRHQELSSGGRWRPPDCKATSKVAVVVPYRDRDYNLRVFLQHIHPFLQKQKLDYGLFISEPLWDGVNRTKGFARGLMRNIGFLEAVMKTNNYDCAVFHDVDLLPENLNNTYECPGKPKHLCVSLDYYNYTPLSHGAIFGGVVSFRKEHFLKVNGYSNLFFGWGGEDDDLLGRCRHHKVKIGRPNGRTGRYKATPHEKSEKGKFFYRLYSEGKYRWDEDEGLKDIKYSVVMKESKLLYTRILADYSEELYANRTLYYFEKAEKIKKAAKVRKKDNYTMQVAE